MLMAFLLLPIILISFTVILYSQIGKKEFLRFDLVQFLISFVISPIILIWVKGFIYILFKQDILDQISLSFFFVIDTVISVVAFFIYAFIIIHSLTKSIELKKKQNHAYDVFGHSEFFHGFFSHFGFYLTALILFTMLSLLNLKFPFLLILSHQVFIFLMMFGVICALFIFIGIWLTVIGKKFYRYMRIAFFIDFLLYLLTIVIFKPNFNSELVIFWLFFLLLLVNTILLNIIPQDIELINQFKQKIREKT